MAFRRAPKTLHQQEVEACVIAIDAVKKYMSTRGPSDLDGIVQGVHAEKRHITPTAIQYGVFANVAIGVLEEKRGKFQLRTVGVQA